MAQPKKLELASVVALANERRRVAPAPSRALPVALKQPPPLLRAAPPPPLLPATTATKSETDAPAAMLALLKRETIVAVGTGADSVTGIPVAVQPIPLDITDDETGESLWGDLEETGAEDIDSARELSAAEQAQGCPGCTRQGKTGPITPGLYELERVVGAAHIHDDYATSGHATHSYHYRGMAMDIDPSEVLWLILYPHRVMFVEFFGPWGLFHNGARFYDAPLQAQHENHIHVAYTGGATTIDRVFRLKRGRGVGAGPSHLPPARSEPIRHGTVYDSWKSLIRRLTLELPSHHAELVKQSNALKGVFK